LLPGAFSETVGSVLIRYPLRKRQCNIAADKVPPLTALLLLGAGGFAGAHFARAADAAGFDVVRAGHRTALDLQVDLLDPPSIERALEDCNPDAIANLAGASSVSASFRDPKRAFEVNAMGVLNLLEAAAERTPGAHITCISSGDIYGSVPVAELPLTEDRLVAPISPYGASKAAMEAVCGFYERARGLRLAVIRSFNHTGPGQSAAFAASSFARQVAEAELEGATEVALRVGDLAIERDFSDVRDIARAYVEVIRREVTGTYNAASGTPTRIGALVEQLGAATELTIRRTEDPGRLRKVDAPILYGSPKRLREATGWRAAIPLSTTMRDLLDWWRDRVTS
jgi:GDP-4-dehydro-6-deoxy-D-mannose reductase